MTSALASERRGSTLLEFTLQKHSVTHQSVRIKKISDRVYSVLLKTEICLNLFFHQFGLDDSFK